MSMTSIKMKRLLEERLGSNEFHTFYNRDNDEFRIEWKESKKGMNIKLPNIITKYNERGEQALNELEYHVKEALKIMNETHSLQGMEKDIYPVIRSTSFPVETKSGKQLITKEHTAETRIFYALDLGKSYRLLDDGMLEEQEWTKDHLHEIAMFNIRSRSTSYKTDRVADNDFHFISTQDGYDASRILNEAFLAEMKANSKGELALSVPHQDVLILADIENETGYDILAQMTIHFFTEGRVPITSLSFIYNEEKLEPIFILAQNKPRNNK